MEKIGQSSPHSICYPAVVNARISDDIMSNLLSWNIRPKKSSNLESNTSDIENHPMLSNLEHKISSEVGQALTFLGLINSFRFLLSPNTAAFWWFLLLPNFSLNWTSYVRVYRWHHSHEIILNWCAMWLIFVLIYRKLAFYMKKSYCTS